MVVLSSPPAPSVPIVNAAFLYISGCNLSVASTTVLAIAPGQARDSSNTIDMAVNAPLFLNSAVNGANGLDVGSLAASTQYAVWLIAASNYIDVDNVYLADPNNVAPAPVNPYPVAGLLSLAGNASPILPAGYDSVRLLGFIETDGSSHFVQATHAPQLMAEALEYDLQPAISVLAGGNATSFTGVDCSTPNVAVPASVALPNVLLHVVVNFIPAAAGDIAEFRPTGQPTPPNPVVIVGLVANVAQTVFLQLVAGVNGSSHVSFDYLVSSSSDSLSVSVLGWVGAPHVAYPV